MISLRNALSEQNWDMVYKSEDVDTAYEAFFNIFQLLYDKYCPIKKIYSLVNEGIAKCMQKEKYTIQRINKT